MTDLSVPDPVQFADVAAYMAAVGGTARAAARDLARADTAAKDAALHAIAAAIRRDAAKLIAANADDVAAARASGVDAAFVERLTLDAATIEAMAQGVEAIAALPDPVGEITDLKFRPTGIQVGKMRVPLGVVGIIYESRPNVTVDAAALCLKAGNATILRGGSEALRSNARDRGLRARRPARGRPSGDRRAGRRDDRPRSRRPSDRGRRSTSTSSFLAAARD